MKFPSYVNFLDEWGPWGEWSPCTVSSDYGTRIRYRQCPDDGRSRSCTGQNYDVEDRVENTYRPKPYAALLTSFDYLNKISIFYRNFFFNKMSFFDQTLL